MLLLKHSIKKLEYKINLWRTKEDYETTSYNLIEQIGERIADEIDIEESEVYLVPSNDHSLHVGTDDNMKWAYNDDGSVPTLEDIKNTDGDKLMHLRSGQPTEDIEGMPTTVPHEKERSSQYIWLTTDPSNIVYNNGRENYEPSLDTASDTEYEARVSLSSHPTKTKTVEKEVDSAMNKIRKMLGRNPNTEESTKVVDSSFKGILESPDPRTKEIIAEIDLNNAELYEDPNASL